MSANEKEWIPFLEESIPIEAHGYKVSSYAVALEGWRRGLTLKYYNVDRNPLKIKYSLSNQEKEHVFAGSRGDLVTKNAIKICINKYLTKKYLVESDVPTPEGERFKEDTQDSEIIDYANKLGYPLVIKPVTGSGGDGVIAGIKNEVEFKEALIYVRKELKHKQIIVERFFAGSDYRIYVIGHEVVGAFDRIPANVVGDGKSTIKKLLKKKMSERQKNPALYNRPITIDNEVYTLLKQNNLTLDSVPKEGKRVFLKTKNNVSSGGDSRDITDELSENIKRIAVNAIKAIPGLVQAGIDIIVDEENDTGVILEINSRPSIRNHLFPMLGRARDIPKAIIDYYFPETKGNPKYKHLYYFDIKSIHDIFKKGLVKGVTIPDMPHTNDLLTRFIVTGSTLDQKYASWIERRVRRLRLNGYIKYFSQSKVAVIVAGSEDAIKKFRYLIKHKTPKKYGVQDVIEKKRNTPVKIGFEVINEPKTKDNKVLNRKKQENRLSNDNQILSETEYVEKRDKENIGLKSSLMEYAALKRNLPTTRLSRSTILIDAGDRGALSFTQMNGICSSKVGKSLCDKKHFTRTILRQKGFTVVESDIFKYKDYDKAKAYVERLGFPVVVKPVFLSRGRGITTNISSFEKLKEAWEKGVNAYKGSNHSKSLIVERHFTGEDYRFFVVGNDVISASHRKRANVTGDGSTTILELIRKKNLERTKNPYLKKFLIPEDPKELDHLMDCGLDLDYKPALEEEVILRKQSNLSAGGDSIDVTDTIHPEYHKIATDAIKAIPGIEYGGVDLIISDISVTPNSDSHIVSEIEFSPAPFNHFHFVGENYDYAGAIVDFYLKR